MPDTGLPNKTQKGIQSLGIRCIFPPVLLRYGSKTPVLLSDSCIPNANLYLNIS